MDTARHDARTLLGLDHNIQNLHNLTTIFSINDWPCICVDCHTVSFVTNSQIISSEPPPSIITFAPSLYQTEDSLVVVLSTDFSVIKSVDIFAVCCVDNWPKISCLAEPSLVNSVDVCLIY